MKLFSLRIRELREKAQMSQLQLAEAIGAQSRSTISMYESGNREPDLETFEALADVFNVPLAYIVGDDSQETLSVPGILPIKRRKVPLLGDVAAGEPIWAEENHEDYVLAEGDICCDFALKVKGDSMEPLLLDGDIVYVREQPDVLDGQIAVVLVDDSATLKVLYHIQDGIQLVSKNSAYAPMIHIGSNASAVRILGLAVQFTRGLI